MTPQRSATLAEMYDADRRSRDSWVKDLAARVFIPHPLIGVGYADGALLDTTAGHVRCTGCRAGRPCQVRR